MNASRAINVLELNRRLLRRILTHHIRSIQQAAMIERIDPDAAARAMKTFSQYLGGGKLIETRDNRIVLSKLSAEALKLLEGFSSLAENQGQQTEKLRFAVSPGVPSELLALSLSRFLFNYGAHVTPEVFVVAEGMRDLVRTRDFAFALDLCVPDSAQADELLAASIPASIAVPLDHRLAESGMIDAEHFSERDLVFLSPYITAASDCLLGRLPAANRIEIADSDLRHRLVAINAGLALEYSNPSSARGDVFIRLPVVEIQPANLGLWLPGKQDQLSEPAKNLISEIRYANLPPIAPLDSGGQSESLPEIAPLPEPLTA